MLSKVLVSLLLLSWICCVASYGTEAVINLVTDGGGSTSARDNTVAFMKAVGLAESTGHPLYVPPGIFNFVHPINSTNVIVRGAGQSLSILQWTVQLGAGVVAYDVYGGYSVIQHLGMATVYGRAAVGSFNANFYGLRMNDAMSISHMDLQYFYAGIVWNSGEGHTTAEHVSSTNNYYGIYVQSSNGDNYIGLSGLAGNTMASIGIPPSGSIGAGDAFYRTHMCFSPYGVYQEGPLGGGDYNNFIFDAHFQLARFESCGNGAIYTENAGTDNYGGIKDTEFYNVGFSWNSVYRIASRAADYAVVVGTVQAPCFYFPGGAGFYAGAQGTWNLNQAENWGNVQQYDTSSIVVS